MTLDDISDATCAERREYYLGKYGPGEYDWIARKVTDEMLDEMHTMLREILNHTVPI